ncbi:hypothetical protein GCM10025858_29810 [Alicyclobacillus sacchari]|uniref:phosphoribosyl-AMP cyclohydrolase n=1 Tax=Alicyclobacillus sacchari TaxID=392010 RepID=UPI0023E9EAE4|nr:hypothetical protein GCM10025858_29810 [Alicyclobacillus sacchari]
MGGIKSEIDLAAVRYDTATGLVPVVVQDTETRDVLMLAYANREALKRTIATGYAWFWSRSRQEYWRKGASSGNLQEVVELRLDCDGDTVLYLVHPLGPACHTGEETCFYRRLTHGGAQMADREARQRDTGRDRHAASVVKDGADPVTAQPPLNPGMEGSIGRSDWTALDALWRTIDARYQERPQGSYTTYLFEHGAMRIGKKWAKRRRRQRLRLSRTKAAAVIGQS